MARWAEDTQELWDGSTHSRTQAGQQELAQLTHITLWMVKVT